MLLITVMGRGGAEVQVRDLARAFRARGHPVALVSLMPFEDFQSELEALGVECCSLGWRKGAPRLAGLFELLRFTRSFRPDVLHGHMFGGNIAARALKGVLRGSGRDVGVVNTAHAGTESARRYRVYRATAALCDAFTCVSAVGLANHEQAGALADGSGVVVPNGVNLESFVVPNAASRAEARAALGLGSEFAWLSVGSFRDESKGFGYLLEGFAEVVRRGEERAHARLLLAGEGRLWEEKRAHAAKLGIAHCVNFLGLRTDVPRLLAASDGFVLASSWESLPVVLLEAAATGLPIVSTKVGDTPRVVEGTGVLVPPRDAANLGVALTQVMASTPEVREEMGRRARERVAREFALEKIVDRWEATYADLTKSAGSE